MSEFVVNCIVSAVVSGIVGSIIIGGLTKAMDKKLKEQEEKERKLEEIQKKRRVNTAKKWSAIGRMLFWISKEMDIYEIKKAYGDFESAEQADKELDKEIVADYEVGNGRD